MLWQIFSPRVFGALAREPIGAGIGAFSSILKRADFVGTISVEGMYSAALAHLGRNQPSEYFYKNALVQWQLFSRGGSRKSRLMFEFRVGQSKLDALLIGKDLHAFEIKTERDRLDRLSGQIADYRTRFPLVSVLSSEKHVAHLERSLPRAVGLGFLSSRRSFRLVREAKHCYEQLRPQLMLECLRRDEYLSILATFGRELHGLPNTRLFAEGMRYAQKLDPRKTLSLLTEVLQARNNHLLSSSLLKLPPAVRAAAIAARCRENEISHVLNSLKQEIMMEGPL